MTSFQNTITYRPTRTAPQHAIGLVLAAALNAGLVYALLAGLGMVPMPAITPPFNSRVIVEHHDIDLPPPPQPTIPPPRIKEYALPTIEIPVVPEGGGNAITVQQAPPSATPEPPQQTASVVPSAPPPPVILTPARAIMATHTIPDYPPVSRRLGEQGTLRLQLAIGANGAVEAATVERSSGHPRLDDAAVQWVKAHWRYEPATQGSKPVPSTTTAEVTFRLR